jgi:hypothetical protein
MKLTQARRSSAPPKHNFTAMDWYDHGNDQRPGMRLLGHGGLTPIKPERSIEKKRPRRKFFFSV